MWRLREVIEDGMNNEHNSSHFCSALLLTSKQTWRLREVIEDHMTNEHNSEDFCSPLLPTSKQTVQPDQLIEDQMAKEHSYETSVHLFPSLRSKLCDSLS
jgi:hypothetical protein